MDNELKQYLDEKFGQTGEKLAEMREKLAEMREKLAQMDGKFATKQDLERVETALLTEFHKWA